VHVIVAFTPGGSRGRSHGDIAREARIKPD